jgi:hypothetical protein
MKTLKFKQGEWCFCEFVLQQVIETEENRITAVSDGMFRLSSNDLSDRCYPLEMIIKIISDEVAYWSKEFHSLKINTLNYPDLNKELIRRWIELCDNRDNEKLLQELFDKLSNFCNSVVNKARDLNFEEVEGVSLFRK